MHEKAQRARGGGAVLKQTATVAAWWAPVPTG